MLLISHERNVRVCVSASRKCDGLDVVSYYNRLDRCHQWGVKPYEAREEVESLLEM